MSFLNLPREIRNQIYFFVIHLEREAPQSPRDESISTNYKVRGSQPPCVKFTCYEDTSFPSPYTDISCTNRQIRAEVREAVTAVQNAGNLVYKVDLMVDGMDIYLTWISIPAPTRQLAELRVDFRRVSDKSFRWSGDGGPGPMVRHLGGLLSRFIAHGPSFFGESGSQPEWQFDVLSLRLLDTEILERTGARDTSRPDWYGLTTCARFLANYNILGNKVQLVKLQHGDAIAKFLIPEKPPSEEHLALWSTYGWYRPSSSS